MYCRQLILALSFIAFCTPITAHSAIQIKIGEADIATFIQKHTEPIIGAIGIAVTVPLFVFGLHKAIDCALPNKNDHRINAGCKATLDIGIAGAIFYVCAKKLGLFGTSEIVSNTN